MEAPRLVRTIYAVRTGAFAYCFLALGLLLWERGAPAPAWGFLAAQFLVYPHLLYLRALKSKRPRQAEFDNLFVDSTLLRRLVRLLRLRAGGSRWAWSPAACSTPR